MHERFITVIMNALSCRLLICCWRAFQSEMENNNFFDNFQTFKSLEWVEEMSVAELGDMIGQLDSEMAT